MNNNPTASGGALKAFLRRVTQPLWLLSLSSLVAAFGVYMLINHTVEPTHFIHCVIDDYIPFNEFFALPYVYWFGFLPVAFVQMLWHRDDRSRWARSDFSRFMWLFFLSWAVCIIVYIVYPSSITFRPTPEEIGYDNFCAAGLALTYSGFDLPHNVLPSLHCTSSIAACLGILTSDFVKKSNYNLLYYLYYVIMTCLICASTVFVKQHSIIDFVAAVIVIAVLYPLVYKLNWRYIRRRASVRIAWVLSRRSTNKVKA